MITKSEKKNNRHSSGEVEQKHDSDLPELVPY